MINGQVFEHEYISAHKLHRRHAVSAMTRATKVAVVIGILLFLAISKKWGAVLVCAGIGGLIGEFVQSRIFFPSKLHRLYAQVKGRVDGTYSWNDEKLFFASGRGHAARSWGDFLKARENDDVILLYHNDAIFEIVAKRWFHEVDDMDEFRCHLKFVMTLKLTSTWG